MVLPSKGTRLKHKRSEDSDLQRQFRGRRGCPERAAAWELSTVAECAGRSCRSTENRRTEGALRSGWGGHAFIIDCPPPPPPDGDS